MKTEAMLYNTSNLFYFSLSQQMARCSQTMGVLWISSAGDDLGESLAGPSFFYTLCVR